MYAVLDIGNTFGKMALYEQGKQLFFERGKVKSLIKSLKKVKTKAILVCSVAQSKDELTATFKEFRNLIILDNNTSLPIINGYGTPETLGYDRLAGAVAAHYLFPGEHCLLIDMGTAIKYDYIDSEAVFRGGIISPGLQMRFKALHTFTKKLPLLEADNIPELIGNSTDSCIKSGVVNGIIAELNGIIERYQKKLDLKILISGGDAGFFESQINYPTFAAPNLVLDGLYRILIHNVENKSFTY